MLKLLYVTANLPHGPGETFVVTEIEALRRRGHEFVVVPVRPKGEILHGGAEQVASFSLSEPLVSLRMIALAVKALATRRRAWSALANLLTRNPRRLIQNLGLFPKSAWVAHEATLRDIDHIHAHFATWPAAVAMTASHLSGIPWSFTAHRYDILDGDLLARKAASASFARFISRDGIEEATRRGMEITPGVTLIHMGIEVPAQPARPGDENVTRILCPAGLRDVKGHHYLLPALTELRDRGLSFRVTLAGDGPLREPIERDIAARGLTGYVTVAGNIPHDELLSRYAGGRYDLVVLPSLHEGIPVSLMEAAGFGVPIVATAVGGTPELLEDAGYVVPPADSAALADAIATAIENPTAARTLAAAARKRVQDEFDIEVVAEELERRFTASP